MKKWNESELKKILSESTSGIKSTATQIRQLQTIVQQKIEYGMEFWSVFFQSTGTLIREQRVPNSAGHHEPLNFEKPS